MRFPDDDACARYLAERRWPDGFVCPACGGRKGWALDRGRPTWECAACRRQTSVTAGTIMHRSHLALKTWFLAAHIVATHSNGISALQLQGQLGIKATAENTESARRLQTMPGVGPVTALAIEAFAPALKSFRCGRDFAAWLGLVPRQNSTGGKQRLGRVTKAGQADIRRLLIVGAMSRLTWLGRKSIRPGSWPARVLERKPKMLVAIALANKMARAIWAMLTRGQDYNRDPVPAAAA